MNLTSTAFVLLATPSLMLAQDAPTHPYQEGEVEAFLQRARAKERPALVLFNFNLGSG